jgi:hypothetical protein
MQRKDGRLTLHRKIRGIVVMPECDRPLLDSAVCLDINNITDTISN